MSSHKQINVIRFYFTHFDTQQQLAILLLGIWCMCFLLTCSFCVICSTGHRFKHGDREFRSDKDVEDKLYNSIKWARLVGSKPREKIKLIIQLKFPFDCQEKVLIKKKKNNTQKNQIKWNLWEKSCKWLHLKMQVVCIDSWMKLWFFHHDTGNRCLLNNFFNFSLAYIDYIHRNEEKAI